MEEVTNAAFTFARVPTCTLVQRIIPRYVFRYARNRSVADGRADREVGEPILNRVLMRHNQNRALPIVDDLWGNITAYWERADLLPQLFGIVEGDRNTLLCCKSIRTKMTGIFYGSTTGTTEEAAQAIAKRMGVATADVHDVADASAGEVGRYDLLLLGSSTWGCGELQDDWYGFLEALKGEDLSGKCVALFGCGDSATYPDTFCDALGLIYDGLQGTGCSLVGTYAPMDYGRVESGLCRDGKLLGLAIDEAEPEKTEARIAAWCELLQTQ